MHPEQAELLRRRPALLPQAVEELLRFMPLGIVSLPVVATEDVELGGVVIRAGEVVMVGQASADRLPWKAGVLVRDVRELPVTW